MQWIFIAVAVIAFAYALVPRLKTVLEAAATVRRGGVDPLPDSPTWRWSRGVFGLVLGPGVQVLATRDLARLYLADGLDIHDAAGLDERLDWMRSSHGDRPTWCGVRTVELVVLGFRAGLLTRSDAAKRIRSVAKDLRSIHQDWDSLGEAFVREHRDVLAEGFTSDGTELGERRLMRRPTSGNAEDYRGLVASQVWCDVEFASGAVVEEEAPRPRRRAGARGRRGGRAVE